MGKSRPKERTSSTKNKGKDGAEEFENINPGEHIHKLTSSFRHLKARVLATTKTETSEKFVRLLQRKIGLLEEDEKELDRMWEESRSKYKKKLFSSTGGSKLKKVVRRSRPTVTLLRHGKRISKRKRAPWKMY